MSAMIRNLLAFALLAASGAAAQPPEPVEPPPEEEGTVCLAVAHVWRGDNRDIARIREIPVPESFRSPFTAGGCTRFQLVEASLIDWHLAFGDEVTTTAALGYLAADPLADPATPADHGRLVARAWRAAEPDLRAAWAISRDRPGKDWRDFRAALDRSPRVRRLRALIRGHARLPLPRPAISSRGRILPIAGLARPGSAAISRRSRRAPACSILPPGPDGFPEDLEIGNALILRQHHPGEIQDVAIRLAIMAARLSRDPADIDAAARLLDANFSPVLRLAAENAERQGDFCDNGDSEDLAAIRAVCREEGDFSRRFTRFWRNQAMVDLLMAADPDHYGERPRGPPSATSGASWAPAPADPAAGRNHPNVQSFSFAISILERGRLESELNGTVYGGDEEDIVALYLARADLFAALAQRARRPNDPRAADAAADFLVGALGDLARAARLVEAARHPGRFRQIATRFLALVDAYEADRARALEADYRGPNAGYARQAAYFRTVLAALDRMAVGASR